MRAIIITYILMMVIAVVYIASAVGLINSSDTTQYFTAEALIHNQNVDMSVYQNAQHYFVYPDYFTHNGQIFSVRGYVGSLISIPLHVAGWGLQYFVTEKGFSDTVLTPFFKYELSIVMLYTFTSVFALIALYKTLFFVTKHQVISVVTTVATAFGTYLWKYSAFYTRQGYSVLILGLLMYYISRLTSRPDKRTRGLFFAMGGLYGLSYGIDPILFIALSLYGIFIGLCALIRRFMRRSVHAHAKPNFLIGWFTVPAVLIIMGITLGNYHFYGKPNSTYAGRVDYLYGELQEKTESFVISAPLIPVMKAALFNFGKLPPEAFSHFNGQTERVHDITSVRYAQKYDFYGLFVLSPFLLFGLFIVFFPRSMQKYFPLVSFCLIVFFLGFAGNSKIFGYWGGNQYDIRYFYPYSILLACASGLVVYEVWRLRHKKYMGVLVYLCVMYWIAAVLYSIAVGWLSVINMYEPALTGERRIWITLQTFFEEYKTHSFQDYLRATFMNRYNAWIAISLTSLFYIVKESIGLFLMRNHVKEAA